jgi:hypothetical protein
MLVQNIHGLRIHANNAQVAREVHLVADCGRLLYADSSGSGSPGFSV